MKVYIILHVGFNYNDEYFYKKNNDEAEVKKVFADKKKAEEEYYRCNLNALKNLIADGFRDYTEGLEDKIGLALWKSEEKARDVWNLLKDRYDNPEVTFENFYYHGSFPQSLRVEDMPTILACSDFLELYLLKEMEVTE